MNALTHAPTQTLAPTTGSLLQQARAWFDTLDVSEQTRKDYQARIGAFLDFLNGQPVGPDTLLNYKRSLNANTSYKPATRAKYFAVARVFCKEGQRRGMLNFDPTANVKANFQDTKGHKKAGLKRPQAERLWMHVLQQQDNQLTVLAALLLFQGLRQAETVRLDWQDVDIQAGTALVLGKGRNDKEKIYLHPKTIAALKALAAERGVTTGPVLVSTANRNRGERLTTRTVNRWITEALQAAGVHNVTVHGARHYFATELIKSGMPLTDVQKYTRHKSLEMLVVYNDEVSHAASLPTYFDTF